MRTNRIICIDDAKYAIDMDAIMEFCFRQDDESTKETEINEGYEENEKGKLAVKTKLIRTLKSPGNVQNDNIRYDLVKTIMGYLFSGDAFKKEGKVNTYEPDFVSGVLINTLIEYKFLKKIK